MKYVALIGVLAAIVIPLGHASVDTSTITVTAVLRELVEPSPGISSRRYTVYDAQDNVIGYQVVSCTPTSRRVRLYQCGATISLPKGKITASGTLTSFYAFRLNVTGADGFYSNSTGLYSARRSGLPRRWTVKIVLES